MNPLWFSHILKREPSRRLWQFFIPSNQISFWMPNIEDVLRQNPSVRFAAIIGPDGKMIKGSMKSETKSLEPASKGEQLYLQWTTMHRSGNDWNSTLEDGGTFWINESLSTFTPSIWTKTTSFSYQPIRSELLTSEILYSSSWLRRRLPARR